VTVAIEERDYYLFGGKGNEYVEILAYFHVQQKENWVTRSRRCLNKLIKFS